ncbi:MAG: MATE family efflux transporter [Desulfobacteraceae bacterium]|nr:MATE family efflux transporter [Desulfobacteraceae bacterium]
MTAIDDHRYQPGYRTILDVSAPLMASTASVMVMEFTDRVFLANHSVEAISAALPAGITAFLFIAFFAGIVGYGSVFVAQYAGAGRHGDVGPILWQALWLALAAGLATSLIALAGEPLFSLAGHPEPVRQLEAVYFSTLMQGAGIHVAGAALAGFFTGLGITRPVMMFHAVGAMVNIPLDYAVINGVGPFPVMGIHGAALATVVSWSVVTGLLSVFVMSREHDRRYAVRRVVWPDRSSMGRLLRYGVPSSLQLTMDILAFAYFSLMVGRIGRLELAVTNIVFSINALAFMPMLGLSVGTSTLVGQCMGNRRPGDAEEVTRKSRHMAFVYLAAVAVLYLGFPGPLIDLFRPRNLPPQAYAAMRQEGILLLWMVTVYIFFDAQYMVYVGTLKGAGDTRFIMQAVSGLSVFVMGVPLYVLVEILDAGLMAAWACVILYIFSLFAVSWGRFRHGRWRRIRMIDEMPPAARLPAGSKGS